MSIPQACPLPRDAGIVARHAFTTAGRSRWRVAPVLSHDAGPQPMPAEAPGDVTQLLSAWAAGDAQALERLMPLVYDELRRLAAGRLRRERPGHTLQTAGLVHEAYMRLMRQNQTDWRNRAHFYAIAARMMRRVLVDHARRYAGKKRGGRRFEVALDSAPEPAAPARPDLVALDDALRALAEIEPEQCRIVELRFFGGLGEPEIAAVLGLSARTVARRWRTARAWLFRHLGAGARGSA